MAANLLEIEEEPGADDIKSAQKITGELLWLLTRSRPDLLYPMARMCSCVTKNPKKVLEVGEQVKGYLAATLQDGLRFEKVEQSGVEMKVFSDASFSPEGSESHGTVVVKLGNSPISWRSSRQSMITLSTAESELLEIVEGFALGESTAVLVEEIVGEIARTAFTDSQSAQAVMVNEGGSWRTRDLRMKAAFARDLIRSGTWSLHHLPGEEMIADLGTKALSSSRMEKLKKELGMTQIEIRKDGDEDELEEKEKGVTVVIPKELEGALRLVMLMMQLKGTNAQEDEKRQGKIWFWTIMSLAMVGLVFIVYQIGKWIEGRCKKVEPENEPSSSVEGPEARPLRLRRRLLEERSNPTEPSPISTQSSRAPSQTVHTHIVEGMREVFRRAESMGEPAGEPGTLLEDFRSSVVFEEVQHPDDWDVEVHGEFPMGKGSPPPSYFRSLEKGKGKGSPVRHQEGEEEEKGSRKGKSEKGEGKKGCEASRSHGDPGQGLGLTSSSSSPPSLPGSQKGKGFGKLPELPNLCGGKGGCRRDPVIITPYGSRYHTRRNCSSLHNSRLLLQSEWCELCSQDGEGGDFATIAAPGETAHASSVCPRVTLKRVFRKCGLCREMEDHMR